MIFLHYMTYPPILENILYFNYNLNIIIQIIITMVHVQKVRGKIALCTTVWTHL